MQKSDMQFTVSETTALLNQIFETAIPNITVIGEVANFKVNQGKWVFFDIKDDESSLSCFMSLFNLHTAIEDGMQVTITARPTVTKWGKFSLTVQTIRPVGEGSIKRAFELLRTKLDVEGLFSSERKRHLPELPQKIGIISSTSAAGYRDFIKILNERFGGLEIIVTPVQVQGQGATEQIIAALKFLNERKEPPEVIAILRGGGSRDDLATFDNEPLVRAVAASRVPTITGIGHEIDTTLVDLVADVRASTPSNAAEILIPDKREILSQINFCLQRMLDAAAENFSRASEKTRRDFREIAAHTTKILTLDEQKFKLLHATFLAFNPREILRRGYAIVRDLAGRIIAESAIGDMIQIETRTAIIDAEVKKVTK
ncbi:exodeoxyribonuclease VII large subunit [Candidatus Saccharibacteria bacterium]|nr:exodeoxyribonuclease VII large subunit [Candidatus Saccharibacteria bacterium]